jgi:hypothetical protein
MEARFWQGYVDEGSSFPEKLARLHAQQVEVGFIRDDLSAMRQYSLRGPSGTALLIDCNPGRALRGSGATRRELPPGALVRGACPDCPLCYDNVLVLQQRLQVGYWIELPGQHRFVVLCNPFPLGRQHFTVSCAAHVPQNWSEDLGEVVEHLLWLADHCGKGYIVLANGVSAGASIEAHRHYQILRPVSGTPLPLQAAAERGGVTVVGSRGEYPLLAVRVAGSHRQVRETAAEIGRLWRQRNPEATESLVACLEDGVPALYYVPRDRRLQGAPLIPRAGSLEVLGELVVEANDVLPFMTFDRAVEILRSIRAPEAARLIADLSYMMATA